MADNPLQPTAPEEVERLRRLAGELQANDVWHEALDRISDEYIRLWRSSSPVATVEREHAYHMLQAVDRLRAQIQSFAQAGRLSRENASANVKRG